MIFRASTIFVLVALVACKPKDQSSDVASLVANGNEPNLALMFQGNISEAVNDFKLLNDTIGDAQTGYNFTVKQYEDSTLASITGKVQQAAALMTVGGTMLLFLGGHGAPSGQLALNDGRFIQYSQIQEAIVAGRQGKGAFQRLVILIFACYSGSWIANIEKSGVGSNKGFALDNLNTNPQLMPPLTTFNPQLQSLYYSQNALKYFGPQNAMAPGATMTNPQVPNLGGTPYVNSTQDYIRNGGYKQLFIMTSSASNELSYFNPGGNSKFVKALAAALSSLFQKRSQNPSVRDLVLATEQGSDQSTVSYAGYPETIFQEPLFNSNMGGTQNTMYPPNGGIIQGPMQQPMYNPNTVGDLTGTFGR